MKKVTHLIFVLVLMASVSYASMSKVDPTPGLIAPNPAGPQNDIWFTDVMWELPTSGQWFGIGCSYESGPLTLWCGDWANFAVFEFDVYGNNTSLNFSTSGNTDPNDHAWVEDDSDIGADDSLFIGDYGTFGGNQVDIYDDISTSPSYRDYSETTYTMGIAYAPEFDVVYYTPTYDTLRWAELTETTLTVVGSQPTDGVGGLAYVPANGGHPPLLILYSQNLWLTILELDAGTGYPNGSIWNGWDAIALPGGITLPGGCEWDGEHLWVVDQVSTDWVFMLGLEGLSPSINVQPTSIGVIKAKFN